jgi:hypothetical protein
MHKLDVENKEMLSCMGFIGYISASQKNSLGKCNVDKQLLVH